MSPRVPENTVVQAMPAPKNEIALRVMRFALSMEPTYQSKEAIRGHLLPMGCG